MRTVTLHDIARFWFTPLGLIMIVTLVGFGSHFIAVELQQEESRYQIIDDLEDLTLDLNNQLPYFYFSTNYFGEAVEDVNTVTPFEIRSTDLPVDQPEVVRAILEQTYEMFDPLEMLKFDEPIFNDLLIETMSDEQSKRLQFLQLQVRRLQSAQKYNLSRDSVLNLPKQFPPFDPDFIYFTDFILEHLLLVEDKVFSTTLSSLLFEDQQDVKFIDGTVPQRFYRIGTVAVIPDEQGRVRTLVSKVQWVDEVPGGSSYNLNMVMTYNHLGQMMEMAFFNAVEGPPVGDAPIVEYWDFDYNYSNQLNHINRWAINFETDELPYPLIQYNLHHYALDSDLEHRFMLAPELLDFGVDERP
jgi:hypothetical protein